MEYREIVDQIKESPILLIGIGHELQIKETLVGEDSSTVAYARKVDQMMRQANQEQIKEYTEAYNVIKKLIQGKDYFIISTNTDGMLEHMGFDADRIVSPCGSVFRMQCGEQEHGVWDIREGLRQQDEAEDFQCPVCHKKGRLNVIKNKPYNEAGYLRQWEIYTRWLQRTINRKIFLLELGEGFETPTVIRWPFEKIAFINQKSVFVRVNRAFPQLTEEMKDRAFSVKEDSMNFLGQISELLNESFYAKISTEETSKE